VTSSPNYASLGLVKVSGKVTLDNKPLSDVEVQLQDPETFIYSYGITDSSGKFSLMFDSRTPGIIPGKKVMRIFSKRKNESQLERDPQTEYEADQENLSNSAVDPASNGKKIPSTVPDCYGSNSKESLQIERGTSSLIIELRSDCSKAQVRQ
jgi:hypothetical protein